MTKARKVSLVWYTKTESGWRRFPVVMGANNRIRRGFVRSKGILREYPSGRFELRTYECRRAVYNPAGDNAADAMAALVRQQHLGAAKGFAEAAGVKVVGEDKRVYIRKAALAYVEDALQRNALEAAEVARNVTAEFIALCGKTYTDEIIKDDVYKFHKALRARGLTDRTINNKHMRLRSFFRFCKLDAAEILPPAPKYDSRIPNIYSIEERRSILAAAGPYMRIALELGLMCGLRDQEIQHLEWQDIHWDTATLRVSSKAHWNFRVKDSEERDLPIPSVLLKHLEQQRKDCPKSLLVLPTSGGKPNGKLLRTLKRLAKSQGLDCGVCEGCRGVLGECQRWTLHKLRRTYGTTLLKNGVDLATVQRFLGHSDLESTMRYLSPSSSTETQKAVNSIAWS